MVGSQDRRSGLTPDVVVDWWGTHAPLDRTFLETNFPCRAACPVGTNAGGYVSLIAKGRFREAYALARAPNPFASVCGRVCAHPCEAACRRGALDGPLHIRALKRVVCEQFGVESGHSFDEILRVVERPRPPAPKPGRVAVIGAGPAGLSCAHDLALMGHRVTVFDAAPVAGGMMRLGIPEYRLPRDLMDREIAFIVHLGVELLDVLAHDPVQCRLLRFPPAVDAGSGLPRRHAREPLEGEGREVGLEGEDGGWHGGNHARWAEHAACQGSGRRGWNKASAMAEVVRNARDIPSVRPVRHFLAAAT